MAEFTYIQLRIVRESRKMPRWQLGNALGVSEDTIERWETGKSRPEPDDVFHIEEVLEAAGIWHAWMLSNYESYRKKFVDLPRNDSLTETLIRTKHETMDVINALNEVERDTLSGEFKSPEQRRKLKKEVQEAMAALQQTLDRISNDD